MKSLSPKTKLRLFIAKRTLGYTADYVEALYKIYLNHDKIIHYRDGYPVYSLSTPALFSKPAANFFARQLFRTIQNKNLPNLMSFAINDMCNVGCAHCSFFTGVDDKTRAVMTLEQCQKLVKDAQELGVSVINFVGGEPTLREDFPDILRSVDKDRSTTVMFTNGFLLGDKIEEYKKAGLDSVYVSIDSANPEEHDRFRRKKGLYGKAVNAIKKTVDLGLSTGISCCITPEGFADGELDALIELGKDLGVHEVLVFDAMPTGRFKDRHDLVDNQDWIEDMIASTRKYNDDASYPGVLVWAYAASHRSVGCSCGTSYFYVSPYGDIMSCDFNHAKFGNVLERPLYKIWDEMSNMDGFRQAKWGGCKIKSSEYRSSGLVSDGASNGASCAC